jgi:hypothetical protein
MTVNAARHHHAVPFVADPEASIASSLVKP